MDITIKDNGVGIAEEQLSKIFNIDESHSTLGTNKEEGSGLGLILCNEFLKKTYSSKNLDNEAVKKYAPNVVAGVARLKAWSDSI